MALPTLMHILGTGYSQQGEPNYAVPVVIQVQTKSQEDSKNIVEVHMLWEQTMDPVNYPDVTPVMDTFWEQQKARGLNCVDCGTDVGL